MEGFKHLIQCHCILPQYRKRNDPVFHKFVVFSLIDENNDVIIKLSQCNNCNAIHKIVDICKSELIPGKESSLSVTTIEDVKISMNEEVADVLESFNVDLATWEETQFVIDNRLFDRQITLTREEVDGKILGKALKIKESGAMRIDPFYIDLTLG